MFVSDGRHGFNLPGTRQDPAGKVPFTIKSNPARFGDQLINSLHALPPQIVNHLGYPTRRDHGTVLGLAKRDPSTPKHKII